MNATIEYDNLNGKVENLKDILGAKINLKNIKLLEVPIEIESNNLEFTLLKIVCNKDIKKFLKKIEQLYQNNNTDVSIVFNYDLTNNTDYYEVLLNKKILEIIENFDISQYYNIKVSLINDEIILWKLHSLEIGETIKIKNKEEDINVENFEPDYLEIQNSFISEIKSLLKNNKKELKNLEDKKEYLNNLLNEIKNNYNFNKLENYRDLLNSYLI